MNELARNTWMLSGKVPDDRNCTRLIPNIFAVFVVIVVGGVNERCAMILSPLISYRKKACALRIFFKDTHSEKYGRISRGTLHVIL